jgi:hypothetical protein
LFVDHPVPFYPVVSGLVHSENHQKHEAHER